MLYWLLHNQCNIACYLACYIACVKKYSMISSWIYNTCYITCISAIYICYITWYITGYITLIFIPDLQQLAPPCGCAGAHKNQHPAAPSASSKSLPPAAWFTKSAPASWPQLQPQRPFLAGPSRSATSKGWAQRACCRCLRQDVYLQQPPDDCQCCEEA